MATWRRLKLKNVAWIFLLAFFLFSLPAAWAQEESVDFWPQEIETPKGVVVVYQPQPEKLEGNKLSSMAAIAIEMKNEDEPVFGAIWFEARLDTDRDTRIATIIDVTITNIRFPEQDDKDQDGKKVDKLKKLLEEEIPKWSIPLSMDRLMTTLELADTRAKATQKINTDPPKIIFMTEPAVLITLDGEENLQEIEGSKLKRVINTPFTILFDPSKKTYYLNADKDTWYTATDISGDWAITKSVPSEIAALAPKEEATPDDQAPQEEDKEPGPPPKIVVATEPTELISSNGKPEFTPLSGTDLLYMSNTDSDVLMDIKKQEYYVLLSGRWFTSSKMEGPWKYIPGDKLPADLAKIPEDSEMGTVLYAVPGTDVAKEAVLDAQIPQTATVDRKKATLTVEYDGEPQFQPIPTTKMNYAINTATPVIELNGTYYACDEAIWFVANSAKGPWQVATFIPDSIYTIPPESPIYNVTYVRIYDSTPEVVYVGYTPGYTNTYVYNNTIVYGTGYWYSGWYGHYYYPRPVTWGFHVRWNPWHGWGIGFSYGYGPFRFSIGYGGWYRGGWWGPGRRHAYRRGYRHGRRSGYRAGYRAGSRNSSRNNMYGSKGNKARTRSQPATAHKRQATKRGSTNRANNVYADKKGNVHRKTDQGWEKRSNKGWESDKSKASQTQQQQFKERQGQMQRDKPTQTQQQKTRQQQTQQQKTRQQQTQQLDRSHQARQQGNKRTSSYNQSRRSSHSRSSRSGGSRGGGGRGGGGRR
jgi:hypothetical protein